MIYNFGDIKINISHISSTPVWNHCRNSFQIVISNQFGKSVSRIFDNYTKEPINEIVGSDLEKLIYEILQCYYITSEDYPTYQLYCDDFDYDVTDNEGNEEYIDNIRFGDALKKILNQEWVNSMGVYFELNK